MLRQTWLDLLFAHWPLPESEVRELVPRALDIDTWDGSAWISVVPFHMSGVRFRLLPAVPGHSTFAELNVRTYVRHAGRPGVWFFSLDAADPLAVRVARRWFHLNYFDARMDVRRERGTLIYESRRTHRGAPGADFRALYQPAGDALYASEDSLDHWLTARYCLYTVDGHGKLWRGEIDHVPWPLHPAEADLRINTMTNGIGIALPKTAALLHYTPRLDVLLWSLDRVS